MEIKRGRRKQKERAIAKPISVEAQMDSNKRQVQRNKEAGLVKITTFIPADKRDEVLDMLAKMRNKHKRRVQRAATQQ